MPYIYIYMAVQSSCDYISCCTMRKDKIIVHPVVQLLEWRFIFTLFYGAFRPQIFTLGCFDSCSQTLHWHPYPAFPTFGGLLSC